MRQCRSRAWACRSVTSAMTRETATPSRASWPSRRLHRGLWSATGRHLPARGGDGAEVADRLVKISDRQGVEGLLDASQAGLEAGNRRPLLQHAGLSLGQRGLASSPP